MNRNNGREIGARLIILRDYLYSNADKTHAVSMKDIQREYANRGFSGKNGAPLNIKTIYSDLAALEGDFGLELEYVEKHKGYILLNPPFEAYELRLIVDSVQASKFITQAEAKKLSEKIVKHFGNGRRQNLNRQAYVYDRIRSQNDSVVKETDHIYEAITTDRKIGFRYFHLRPDRKKEYSFDGRQINVSPFALYWNGGNLYLYAYDGKKFRFYRVDRMERISNPLPANREGKELFSTKSLTRQKVKVFQMYAGEECLVKMRFRNEQTDAVLDQFGRDLVMIPDSSGHFTFTAPIEISPPFFAWIATFGRRAKIISPPAAVDGMKDFLQKSADMYKDDGNT
ncbi:MAG: WYL domain-containing protein [Oscillospiraceae bacterium]|nr:WYL domain-containing protein [Oscillospiraceae bacterium]